MRERLHANPVPIQVPIGAEEDFKGVIDLVKMKSIIWNEEDNGSTFVYSEIPERSDGLATEWREKMIEAAAEVKRRIDGKVFRRS